MYDIDDHKEKKMAIMRASVGVVALAILGIIGHCMIIDNAFFELMHVKVTLGVIGSCCLLAIVLVIMCDNS